MSDRATFGADLIAALRREWWIVVIALAVALGVGFFVAPSATPTYSATGTVSLDAIALSRFAPLMTGDRLLEALQSADFQEYATQKTGVSASAVKADTSVTGANKANDRLTVRVTGTERAKTQQFATAFRQAVIDYVTEKGTSEEVARCKTLLRAAQDSLTLAQAQKKRVLSGSNDPLSLVEIEGRIMEFSDTVITTQSELKALEGAYRADGAMTVSEQSTKAKIERTVVGAGILGLFIGLALAVVREYVLRRPEGSAA